ncbi:hypothetical protein [Actinacidiphila yeochonensis]|uniref:hypothetical protein n=1 Tax=Actinacidiphila yeochonensis TaxID=89050 RepID=UPI000A6434F6|nr:hypothetical protein [Actinacidiphila yeochonensis]
MLIATNERGHVVKRPSTPAVGTMLANLGRGNAYLILDRVEEEQPGSWYIQVLLRDNNSYQLEYRDGSPQLHFWTRTISQEKVLAALLGWAGGKPDWREGFMWKSIAELFDASCETPRPSVVPRPSGATESP